MHSDKDTWPRSSPHHIRLCVRTRRSGCHIIATIDGSRLSRAVVLRWRFSVDSIRRRRRSICWLLHPWESRRGEPPHGALDKPRQHVMRRLHKREADAADGEERDGCHRCLSCFHPRQEGRQTRDDVVVFEVRSGLSI